MIKRFVLFILILMVSIWLGIQIKFNPGYILIANRQWTLETPLWFGALCLIFSFIVLYYFIRFLVRTRRLPGIIRAWSRKRRLRRAQRYTDIGLIEFAEGHFAKAEKYLVRAIKYSDAPLINYLTAARAAQEQNAYDRRDEYLRRAHQTNPAAEIAIGIAQAQLQISHQQFEQALATLQHLHDIAPQHDYVLKLLQKVYAILGEWQKLANLLPLLKRRKIFTTSQLTELEQKLAIGLLTQSNTADRSKIWQSLSRDVKKMPLVLKTYLTTAPSQSLPNAEIEALLRDAIKQHWDLELVRLYGLIYTTDAHKTLAQAESWVKEHPQDATLLLTLGRLCVRNQLWGKARDYFESSLALIATPEGYSALGQLLEQLNEKEKASECYRKGLLALV